MIIVTIMIIITIMIMIMIIIGMLLAAKLADACDGSSLTTLGTPPSNLAYCVFVTVFLLYIVSVFVFVSDNSWSSFFEFSPFMPFYHSHSGTLPPAHLIQCMQIYLRNNILVYHFSMTFLKLGLFWDQRWLKIDNTPV